MRNMTMKAGEAEVGMNKSGNQLRRQNMITDEARYGLRMLKFVLKWVYMKQDPDSE